MNHASPAVTGQLLRFGLVGLLNTALGLGAIAILKYGFGWPDLPANAGGYALGLLLAFFLNRAWTFGNRGPMCESVPRFAAAAALAWGFNVVVVLVVKHAAGGTGLVPHVAGMAGYSMVLFALTRLWVFAPRAPITRR